MPKKKIKIRRVTKKNSSILSRLHPLKALFAVVILSAFGIALFAGMNANNNKSVLGATTILPTACSGSGSSGGYCFYNSGGGCGNLKLSGHSGSCSSVGSNYVCCTPSCTVGNYGCSTGGNLQECTGAAWTLITTCTKTQTCKSVNSSYNCYNNPTPTPKPICTAGNYQCSGSKLQKCNTTGSAWTTTKTCTSTQTCKSVNSSYNCYNNPTPTPKKTPTPTPKPSITPTPKKITLKAPTNLKTTTSCWGDDTSGMKFTWNKVSGATGYNFFSKIGPYSNYTSEFTYAITGAALPKLNVMNSLPPNQTVYWYVNAVDKNSGSVSPNSVIASKKAVVCKILPAKFNLSSSSHDCPLARGVELPYPRITLTWDVSVGKDYYILHWKYSNSSYRNIQINDYPNSYQFNPDENKKGTKISWYVTASNKDGSTNSSDPKKVGTVTVPSCN